MGSHVAGLPNDVRDALSAVPIHVRITVTIEINMLRNQREWWLLGAAVALLAFGAWVGMHTPKPPRVVSLRMTAGNAIGIRHRLAVEFAKESRAFGFNIEVIPTDGSEEALEKLNSGSFDLALVQGGLFDDSIRHVRQICPLHVEPLHALVKPGLLEPVLQNGLQHLQGHSINRGSPGSGTYLLATEVLRFAGLRIDKMGASHDFYSDTKSYAELIDAKEIESLPDAFFSVSTLPSPIANALIDSFQYQLLPLEFGEAFSIEAMAQLGAEGNRSLIDRRHVFATSIPPFTYSVERRMPNRTLPTIGTRLLFVANANVDGDTISRLLEVLFQSSIATNEQPTIDASLLDLPTEFPMHVGTQSYRQRNKPIIAGDAVDYFEKVLAITATLAGGTFFVVQWARQKARRRRESSFANYMERVMTIERESLLNELSAKLDLASLIRLQKELADLKSEAVTKFANGQLEGEGLIHGFLALVNDSRDQLTRLILHQRENIEQLAAQQHDSPDQVWLQQSKERSPNSAQG